MAANDLLSLVLGLILGIMAFGVGVLCGILMAWDNLGQTQELRDYLESLFREREE